MGQYFLFAFLVQTMYYVIWEVEIIYTKMRFLCVYYCKLYKYNTLKGLLNPNNIRTVNC